jgi:hypothetical protein
MNSARLCFTVLGTLGLAVSLMGCDGGGAEAFAPGTAHGVAPDSNEAHQPIGPSGPDSTFRPRGRQGNRQTAGPRERP